MSDIKIGYLRRDDDGHWFLIPENLITAFDEILRQELPDEFCHTGEDFEELWKSEMMKFDKYRAKKHYRKSESINGVTRIMSTMGHKILYVCKNKPRTSFCEGIDVYLLGWNDLSDLYGKRYFHWFVEDGLELSDEEKFEFNCSIYKN